MTADFINFITAPTGLGGLTMLIIKSTVVIGLGLLLWLALRGASASARHLVLGATLVATVLLPVISLIVPPLAVPLLEQQTTMQLAAKQMAPAAQDSVTAVSESDLQRTENPVASGQPATMSATDSVLIVYLAGVFLIIAHLCIGLGRVWWLTRSSASVVNHRQWVLPRHRTANARLLMTERLTAPLTWGVLRPVILLPASANNWSEQDRKNALLHELAHVERKDWLMQMLARLVCAAYWFNPLVWIARRHLVLEAELAADDRVLESGSAADEYAQQLVNLTQLTRGSRLHVAATTMADQGLLSRRVYSILNSGEHRMPLNHISKYILLSVVSISAMLIGSAQLVAAPQDAAAGSSVEIPDDVATPLIRAAARGDNDEVLRLVQSGADVNEAWEGRRDQYDQDRDGYASERDRYRLQRTALTTAASKGHVDVVRTLLDAGAPVDRVVKGDATALIEAAQHNHFDVTRLLIDRGADVNKAVKGDGSPLIAAARGNNVEAMQLMLARGADPNFEVRGDENPLFQTVSNGNAEAAQVLIDAGVDVNQEWRGDGTPLLVATRSGDPATVDALIRAGARADQGVRGDGNAMIVAAQRGDIALLQKMLESGVDANAAVKGDGSPLIQAARNGHMEAVVMLLQAGADIDLVVSGDENALIGAAWQGDIEMVDYLLKSGADPNIQAPQGRGEVRTALRQARLAGHDEVIRMLESAGATE